MYVSLCLCGELVTAEIQDKREIPRNPPEPPQDLLQPEFVIHVLRPVDHDKEVAPRCFLWVDQELPEKSGLSYRVLADVHHGGTETQRDFIII